MSVLLGKGDWSFTYPIMTDAITSPASVVVDDFNADGRFDAAVADYGSSSVLVMLNDGIWLDPNTPDVQIWDEVIVDG